jgi:hypothetical protein
VDCPAAFYGKEHFVYLPSLEEMGQKFIKEVCDVIAKGVIA